MIFANKKLIFALFSPLKLNSKKSFARKVSPEIREVHKSAELSVAVNRAPVKYGVSKCSPNFPTEE